MVGHKIYAVLNKIEAIKPEERDSFSLERAQIVFINENKTIKHDIM